MYQIITNIIIIKYNNNFGNIPQNNSSDNISKRRNTKIPTPKQNENTNSFKTFTNTIFTVI